MKTIIKLIKSYLLYLVTAFGISLGIIANIGVSSYNSMNLAIANSAEIKVGTVTIFLNLTFLLLYMVLTRFTKWLKYLNQALAVFMFGMVVNFFTYTVLGGITDLTYFQRVLLISLGTIIGGSAVGGIIHYNVITFPLENLCLRLSDLSKFSFIRIRYAIDIIAVTLSIILTSINGLPLYVREGTIISMILLAASINLSKDIFSKKILTKLT